MSSTNYRNTLIRVADDCPRTVAEVPVASGRTRSIATLQHQLISAHPYGLTSDDVEWLRGTVARHAELTGSPVAQELLDNWAKASMQFKRVMPIDYQRVLKVMAQAQVDGLDEAATLDRVMEASRG